MWSAGEKPGCVLGQHEQCERKLQTTPLACTSDSTHTALCFGAVIGTAASLSASPTADGILVWCGCKFVCAGGGAGHDPGCALSGGGQRGAAGRHPPAGRTPGRRAGRRRAERLPRPQRGRQQQQHAGACALLRRPPPSWTIPFQAQSRPLCATWSELVLEPWMACQRHTRMWLGRDVNQPVENLRVMCCANQRKHLSRCMLKAPP